MPLHPARRAPAAFGLLAGLTVAAACTSGPGPTPAAATPTAPPEATAVARIVPTATPTVAATPDPWAPVPSEAIAGVVVPAGAVLVEATAATAERDARADYRMAGAAADADALSSWFAREMVEAGWGEPEDREGALVFLHREALSTRHAGEGLKRTALVLFDVDEGVDFALIVEE